MTKLRTIDKAVDELKKADPDTALTVWALRQLVKNGAIPVLKVGNKQLVSMEAVENFVASQFEGV